jgi:hypothetical protein
VILCGGLGASPFVRSKIEEFVAAELGEKVRVISPDRPWSAIARGGAIRCLDEKPPVCFRRARDYIGITVHKKFDKDVHNKKDHVVCPLKGDRAKDQMQWIVQRVSTKLSLRMRHLLTILGRQDGTENGEEAQCLCGHQEVGV